MRIAIVFPGQGAQFPGMGKDLYDTNEKAKGLMDEADKILGFELSKIMFEGSKDDLQQTKVTQPAVFLHSVANFFAHTLDQKVEMAAGHSLGELSALVASGCLSFESGLQLVSERALAMQEACEQNPGTMAAVLGMEDEAIENILDSIRDEVVVAANYNSPGQLVISGSLKGIDLAVEALKSAGAKRVMPLPVGGAFHSPLMAPAEERLAKAIEETTFNQPSFPIYQNMDANPSSDTATIKKKLLSQLTSPVRWSQSVREMAKDGADTFLECGPGKVLQGLVKKIDRSFSTGAYGEELSS